MNGTMNRPTSDQYRRLLAVHEAMMRKAPAGSVVLYPLEWTRDSYEAFLRHHERELIRAA